MLLDLFDGLSPANFVVAPAFDATLIARPSQETSSLFARPLNEHCWRKSNVVRLNVIHASAVGLAAGAIAALIFPAALLRGMGIPEYSTAMLGVIRLTGVLLMALASVLWSARFWLLSSPGAPTLRTLAVIYGVSAVMILAQQMAAGRVLESVIPIVYLSIVAFEYQATARRYSRRFGATA